MTLLLIACGVGAWLAVVTLVLCLCVMAGRDETAAAPVAGDAPSRRRSLRPALRLHPR